MDIRFCLIYYKTYVYYGTLRSSYFILRSVLVLKHATAWLSDIPSVGPENSKKQCIIVTVLPFFFSNFVHLFSLYVKISFGALVIFHAVVTGYVMS